jgi:hypothetical protein
VPRPTTHNKGTTRSEAEGVLGESLAMADPDLAFYVECNEVLRARHEALRERVAKLERAHEAIVMNLDGQAADGNIFPQAALRIAREALAE